MKKLRTMLKKAAAYVMAATIITGTVTGCAYSSMDDYLKDLGILDPNEYEEPESKPPIVVYEYEFPEKEQITPSAEASKDNSVQADSVDVQTKENQAQAQTQEQPQEATLFSTAADTVYSSTYTTAENSGNNDAIKAERAAVGLTDSGIEELKRQQEGYYAYQRLTDAGKTLYVEILAVLQNMANDVTISTTSNAAVELIYDYCLADHPEIFYVDGYQYTEYTLGDKVNRITFSGNYLYDKEEVDKRKTLINEEVNRCLAGAPSTTDEYYIVKYIYEYLISNTEYDMEAEDNQNICSVFLGKRSVCNGYSKAAQYLLNKLGIQCLLVTGTVDTKNSTGVRHAWNLVRCNDAYYYLDVTWGDASYQTVSGETADSSKLPEVNYDYLNVSTSEISRNHTMFDLIYLPVCKSMKDNYYVREDEYFTTAELSLVGDLFDRRYNDGSNNVTIKCATDDVYKSLFNDLITERKVFSYLQGGTSTISYTAFESTRTIIFWI